MSRKFGTERSPNREPYRIFFILRCWMKLVSARILGIQERVRQLNGNREIFSREGQGTSISVLIPEEQVIQEAAS